MRRRRRLRRKGIGARGQSLSWCRAGFRVVVRAPLRQVQGFYNGVPFSGNNGAPLRVTTSDAKSIRRGPLRLPTRVEKLGLRSSSVQVVFPWCWLKGRTVIVNLIATLIDPLLNGTLKDPSKSNPCSNPIAFVFWAPGLENLQNPKPSTPKLNPSPAQPRNTEPLNPPKP